MDTGLRDGWPDVLYGVWGEMMGCLGQWLQKWGEEAFSGADRKGIGEGYAKQWFRNDIGKYSKYFGEPDVL